MKRKGQIKLLKEYRNHILFMDRERRNIEYQKITKEKPKVLTLTRSFYGKNLKIG